MQSYQEQEQGQTFHKTAIGRKTDRLTEKPKPDKEANRKTEKNTKRKTDKQANIVLKIYYSSQKPGF